MEPEYFTSLKEATSNAFDEMLKKINEAGAVVDVEMSDGHASPKRIKLTEGRGE